MECYIYRIVGSISHEYFASSLAQVSHNLKDYVDVLKVNQRAIFFSGVRDSLSKAILPHVAFFGRRILDMEGWATDIAGIRKRQQALEKKLLQAQLIRRLPGMDSAQGSASTQAGSPVISQVQHQLLQLKVLNLNPPFYLHLRQCVLLSHRHETVVCPNL